MNLEISAIDNALKNRLKTTVQCYEALDSEDDYVEKVIFFKLYFDFSTAIEALLKTCLQEDYKYDDYVTKRLGLLNQKSSFYLEIDDLKKFMGSYYPIKTGSQIKSLQPFYFAFQNDNKIKSSILKMQNTSVIEKDTFYASYGELYQYRNDLAHSPFLSKARFTADKVKGAFLAYILVYEYALNKFR